MKTETTAKKKIRSKGDRLNWPSLKDEKPVQLTPELLQGEWVTEKDLAERRVSASDTANFIVP